MLLQTAQTGISQDANEILDQFPSTAEELYKYDCIVAFDPDWTELDATQVELLEKWISEEAGGLIVVAGPIQTPSGLAAPSTPSSATCIRSCFNNGSRYWTMANTAAKSRGRCDRARRPRGEVSVACANRPRKASRLGQLSRRLRLLRREGREAGRDCVRAAFPIPKPAFRASGPCTWPATFTAAARCSTSAAANCGGCEASIRRISKCCTRS